MLGVQDYDSVLSPVYGGYTAKINYMVSTILIGNAAEYTGISATEGYLRTAIAENKSNSDSVGSGVALVETNQGYTDDILAKMSQMRDIIDDAVGGGYSSSELADMQAEIDLLAEEIDDIAQGPLGETHMLTSDGQSESVFIGSGLSISIDTHDMDSDSGLGLGGIDVDSDAAAASAAVAAAIGEVVQYSSYLQGKHDVLVAASASLDVQGKALLAVESVIESVDAAMMMVGMINSEATSSTNLLMAVQSNLTSDTVLNLLVD